MINSSTVHIIAILSAVTLMLANIAIATSIPIPTLVQHAYAQRIPPPPELATNSIYLMTNDSKTLSTHKYDGLIVDHKIPFNSIKVGDLIVFNPVGHHHTIIISKVTKIVNDLNSVSLKTRDSVNVSQQNYIGKVVYDIRGLGADVKPPVSKEVGYK